jgi:hypothetical protein
VRVALLLVLALLSGGKDRVPEGAWGGRDASLHVGDRGAEVEFNCSHGAIEEPLSLDEGHAFRARGYWVREGGPTMPEEDRRPAVYSGKLDGKTLTLRVAVEDPKRELGPFTLVLGEPARLVKCD